MEFHDRFSISKAGYDHNIPSDVIYRQEFLGKSGGDSREEVCVCSSCCSSCSHPSSFPYPGMLHPRPIRLRHQRSKRTQCSRSRPEPSPTETSGTRRGRSIAPLHSSPGSLSRRGLATGPSSLTSLRSSSWESPPRLTSSTPTPSTSTAHSLLRTTMGTASPSDRCSASPPA